MRRYFEGLCAHVRLDADRKMLNAMFSLDWSDILEPDTLQSKPQARDPMNR